MQMLENFLALDTANKFALSLSSIAIFLTLVNLLISALARRTEWRLTALEAAAEASAYADQILSTCDRLIPLIDSTFGVSGMAGSGLRNEHMSEARSYSTGAIHIKDAASKEIELLSAKFRVQVSLSRRTGEMMLLKNQAKSALEIVMGMHEMFVRDLSYARSRSAQTGQ